MSNVSPNRFEPSAGNETANSAARRRAAGWYESVFAGRVLDIGCGKETVCPQADGWDIARGDPSAVALAGVPNESYDCVYASHVLEHLDDPEVAVSRWWEVVKPGGYLVLAVPDEDLYEKQIFPSLFNADHRYAWTTHKVGCARHTGAKSLIDMTRVLPGSKLLGLRICDDRFDYGAPQTMDQALAERQAEMVVQKVATDDLFTSLRTRCGCKCGSQTLRALGYVVGGRMIVECMSCGQRMHAPESIRDSKP